MAKAVYKISLADTLRSFNVGESLTFQYDEIKTTSTVLNSTIYLLKKRGSLERHIRFSIKTLPLRALVISRLDDYTDEELENRKKKS